MKDTGTHRSDIVILRKSPGALLCGLLLLEEG